MNRITTILIAIVAIIVILGCVIGSTVLNTYNSLQRADQDVENQWAKVESKYQRRFDLIPNLVKSVKGSMGQEEKVFGDIADARTRYAGASSGSQEKIDAMGDLESAIGRLLVIMENYPELKSIDRVHDLMIQLEGTENRISVERDRYSDEVRKFNDRIVTFPTNIIASAFGFKEKPFFEAEKGAEKAPEVDL